MESAADKINIWLDIAEETLHGHKGIEMKNIQNEIQKVKIIKKIYKKSIREIWDNFRWSSVWVMYTQLVSP